MIAQMNGFAAWIEQTSGGLTLRPSDKGAAIRDAGISIVAVTALIVALDVTFRRSLDPGYVTFFTGPLWPRTLLVCLIALGEEVRFRLIAMTAVFAAVKALRGRVSPGWALAAILVCQLANVGMLVAADPLYGLFRWWLVGSVWGWLYWRHGWFTGTIAHCATHLVMGPLLLLALS